MASVFGEQEDRYGWLREKLERRDKQGNLIKSSFGKRSPKAITPRMQQRQVESEKDINKFTQKELRESVKLMAQRANRRLKEIEEANLKKASNAYRWAERQSFDNQRFMRQQEQPRFRTDLRGATLAELREEMSELRTFLFESTTSSVKGTRAKYEKGFEEAKKYFGNELGDMTLDEWGFLWSANNMEAFVRQYGSDVIVTLREIKTERLTKEELEALLEKFMEETVRPSIMTIQRRIPEVANEVRRTRSLEEENEDGSLTALADSIH